MSHVKSSGEIRSDFLTFFREKGHEIVPSDSLVPKDDPTLLFTNAGMNQFKDVFLGTGERPYKRAANTQKCLRVSGKHNDLEEVGLDTYHHTFFEMLGNWSFGDYFKREAIRWAWELLVGMWGLEPDRLYATVHAGDEKLGLEADVEAADLWRGETGIPPENVLFGSTADNFWMMGETGPCGPCSEVHVDLRSDVERGRIAGADLVNTGRPDVIELWNLVFIQYDARTDGSLEPLKDKHVDTGMGFERLVVVLQGKTSNYDTDLFEPLLRAIAELSPRVEVRGYDHVDVEDEHERERCRIAMRVIADHARTIAFAIADGVTPGNLGRAYVIRRILRRAVRFGYQTLGMREPFLYRLVEPLEAAMGSTFPELREHRDYVERVTKAEEENFLQTLGVGLTFFDRVVPYVKRLAHASDGSDAEIEVGAMLNELKSDRQTMALLEKAFDVSGREEIVDVFSAAARLGCVPGEIAFLLHDTYGFPVDLTRLMAREEGLDVDMTRYGALMDMQKQRARAASTFKPVDVAGGAVDLPHLAHDRFAAVDDGGWAWLAKDADSEFLGYDTTELEAARIRALRATSAGNGRPRCEILLDRTPFYAESGGQIGDVGVLLCGDERIEVLDTVKDGDHVVHVVDRFPDEPELPLKAVVTADRRHRIAKHHTATHLLHAALREVLGEHVQQKGSLVAADRLRFDFSHYGRVTPDELREVEARVNAAIQANVPRQEERDVPLEEAFARGARALFGEKYGERVRVITFDPAFSVELCGGTHVASTGELGLFRFVSEGSVASGIRRVEAVTGQEALDFVNRELAELERVRSHFKSLQRPISEEVRAVLDENRDLRKHLEEEKQKHLVGELEVFIRHARQVDGVRLVTGRVDAVAMDTLHELGQTLRERLDGRSVGILGSVDSEGDKVYLVASVADDVIHEYGLKAGDLVARLARIVGGGGGGRPAIATAGGRQPEKLDAALDAAEGHLREMLALRK